jgi:thiol-disulfide isomerase/thioredoxin
LIDPVTGLCIATECTLGVALTLEIYPHWLLPLAIGLLLVLSSLTIWGTANGRVESCGCYNGLIEPTPRQSVFLNAAYGILLGLAWCSQVNAPEPTSWQLLVTGLVFPTSALLTLACFVYFLKRGRPLIEFGALRIGTPWRLELLGGVGMHLERRTHVVAFLAHGCPVCQRTHGVLHELHDRPGEPDVFGVVSKDVGVKEFAQAENIRFPLAAVPQATLKRLLYGYPTILLIHDGRIGEKRVGPAAHRFLERLHLSLDEGDHPAPVAAAAISPTPTSEA